jgi:hypothetical protein
MPPPSAAIDLLHRQIADADTQWSLGTFGGIAEFSRDRNEKVTLAQSATGAAAVTARGGIAIDLSDGCRPFAFECITTASWSQRVAFCLPASHCAMNRRAALTELETDHSALRPQDRASILFDLGLGALQADLCRRSRHGYEAAAALWMFGVRFRKPRDGLAARNKSASRFHKPDRPDRGLPADSSAVGQKSGRTTYARAAEAIKKRPDPCRHRADP